MNAEFFQFGGFQFPQQTSSSDIEIQYMPSNNIAQPPIQENRQVGRTLFVMPNQQISASFNGQVQSKAEQDSKQNTVSIHNDAL